MIIIPKGCVETIVQYKDGSSEILDINKNAVLTAGKQALASSLANNIGSTYGFYINRMLFGTNGTVGGVPKIVESSRNGLFGATLLTKPVIASIDPVVPQLVTFTSVIAFDEGVGSTINEMALQMKSGDLYSMISRGDVAKTSEMQLVFNWYINFI